MLVCHSVVTMSQRAVLSFLSFLFFSFVFAQLSYAKLSVRLFFVVLIKKSLCVIVVFCRNSEKGFVCITVFLVTVLLLWGKEILFLLAPSLLLFFGNIVFVIDHVL